MRQDVGELFEIYESEIKELKDNIRCQDLELNKSIGEKEKFEI